VIEPTSEVPPPPRLISDAKGLAELEAECCQASEIALDAEADGLHRYRPQLCALQLAWKLTDSEDAPIHVAVIDTLIVDISPLERLLGGDGPWKIIHDLTFDARLLADAGLPLARARDTSVAARFLGRVSTGLAALVEEGMGVRLDKSLQQHDWSRRPITARQLAYLAADVQFLLPLCDMLEREIGALDIASEVTEECAYKLACALAPSAEERPSYARMKGALGLDAQGKAVLRRLVAARESAAERLDVPPFKVVGNAALLDMAAKRPRRQEELRRIAGATSGRANALRREWLQAVDAGIEEGELPPAELAHFERPRVSREDGIRRKRREQQVSAWRKAEAARRGVSDQVVLPGHCARDLADRLMLVGDEPALRDRIAAIPGLGAQRLTRYWEPWVALWRAEA